MLFFLFSFLFFSFTYIYILFTYLFTYLFIYLFVLFFVSHSIVMACLLTTSISLLGTLSHSAGYTNSWYIYTCVLYNSWFPTTLVGRGG